MRYGTVCSGVEAFGPAWAALGMECAFHAEIAAHPSAVLRYQYPNTPNYGDFTQIHSERIDLLAGGTPCQDFSVAGLRKGLARERGNLTLEFARLAERLRPRWLVWENVPGVLSADGGRAFGQFLALLAECGYYAAYRVLDAQHFGVPQRRRRVFVVGHSGDWRAAAAVLFENESLRGLAAPRRETGAQIAQSLTTRLGSGGPDDNLAQGGFYIPVQAFGGNNQAEPIDVATCLTAHGSASGRLDFESETFLVGTLCASGKAAGSATQQDAESNLLVAGDDDVRRLTPLECERLMGYPDNWTRYGIKANGTTYEVADGPRYQMCGNGWATPVANWIAERVMLVESLLSR